jgi:dCMP deaminase
MYKGYYDLSGKYWYDIKYCAAKRKINFSNKLTIEYAWDLFVKQDKKCALSGLDIALYPDIKTRNTASLDRIDSSKGYEIDNVQWLHKKVNNLKCDFNNEETVNLCRKIVKNSMKNIKDLSGQKFGDLTVIKQGNGKIVGIKNPKKRSTWICECSCGKQVDVLSSNLRHVGRGTKSCGCKKLTNKKYNFTDLTNKKFGQLLVIKLLKEKTKTRGCYWECLCDCGEIIKLASNSLTSGNNITCGKLKNHYKNDLDPRYNFFKEIPRSHLNQIKQNAIKRNYEYSVTPEYLWNLFIKQNRKCQLTGENIEFTKNRNSSKFSKETTASLDRIDSSRGYIEGNVQWLHKNVNIMKNTLNNNDFITISRKIIDNYYFNNRPCWDEYFLNLAFNVSYRSEDPNIKHGAIIIDDLNHICGTGYNAMIKGAKNIVDLNNRDEKRKFMIHAEENAIINCQSNKNGLKMYITGEPCNNCLQRIINFNIKEIIVADRIGSITENKESRKMKNVLLKSSGLKIKKINLKNLLLEY